MCGITGGGLWRRSSVPGGVLRVVLLPGLDWWECGVTGRGCGGEVASLVEGCGGTFRNR